MDKEAIDSEIQKLEEKTQAYDFWADKEYAKSVIQKIKELKQQKDGFSLYDSGGAIMTIFSGAGGDDAEDFSRMLAGMYMRYCEKHSFAVTLLNKNENSLGGYRNITLELSGRGVYGLLKHESGVHRLVRLSPFNSKSLRQTSFSMVEIVPIIERGKDEIRPEDIDIEFTRTGGPGGQNVNKRETTVRVTHKETKLSVCVSTERSQEQNKQKALEMLSGKLFVLGEERQRRELEGHAISKTVEIEWGSQIRSYVLHPYKMIKDHRTEVETSNVEKVLEDGDIDMFIEAEKNLS